MENENVFSQGNINSQNRPRTWILITFSLFHLKPPITSINNQCLVANLKRCNFPRRHINFKSEYNFSKYQDLSTTIVIKHEM